VEKNANENFVKINQKSIKGQITAYIRVRNQALCATSCTESLKIIVINEYNSLQAPTVVVWLLVFFYYLRWFNLIHFFPGILPRGPETPLHRSFNLIKFH